MVHVHCLDPSLWRLEHVHDWLQWIVREYNIRPADVARLSSMDGKQIVRLTREDFGQLMTNPYAADIIWSHLNFLRSQKKSTCKILFIFHIDRLARYLGKVNYGKARNAHVK